MLRLATTSVTYLVPCPVDVVVMMDVYLNNGVLVNWGVYVDEYGILEEALEKQLKLDLVNVKDMKAQQLEKSIELRNRRPLL